VMKKGRPTITDVARAAGVSVGTVSNFLNGTVPVKAETAEKIQ
jgi:DNA-binding LacI/PurR family transcriptional regulator